MKLSRWLDFVLILFLFTLALSLSLYYGRIGFMALDQSIVFDGAWRVLSGQIPYRDFHTPNGITPILMQVPFFVCFGVNWLSYCLHAAVINGLFCLLVYWLLRLLGGSQLLCFFYALLSAVVMYTPMGVPYMDQHAFFFTLLAIVFSVAALKTDIFKIQILYWFGVSAALIFAYLSKQVPSLFAFPLILFMILLSERKKLQSLFILSFFVFFLIGLLWMAAELFGMNWQQVQYYFYELPSNLGKSRLSLLFNQGTLFNETLKKEGGAFYSFYLTQLAVLSLGLFLFVFTIRRADKKEWTFYKRTLLNYFFEFGLLEGLFLICFLFLLVTQNQLANGIPFIFTSVGIMHIFFEKQKALNITFSIRGMKKIVPETVLTLVGILFMLACLRDVSLFHEKINKTRNAHDIVYLKEPFLDQSRLNLPKALSFLVWKTAYPQKAENVQELVAFFESHPGNLFLLGDTSILYGITKRPSIAPSLWFHPKLTLPPFNTPEFEAYENQLIRNIEKHNVKYIVFEGGTTWEGVRLAHFSKLVTLIKQRGGAKIKFGPFLVIELSFDKDAFS